MSNILDIYKAYSLERIVALNKQSLAMQYEQCGQLVALQKQLRTANMTSQQMLRNQVKELERQEKVRYCKNLIFNIKGLIERLDSVTDDSFFFYVCSALVSPMTILSNECVNGLEDIADKEYAKGVLKMIGTLQQKMLSAQSQFNVSEWKRYEDLKSQEKSPEIPKKIRELENTRKKTEEEIQQLQAEISGIFSIFVKQTKKDRYAHTISVKKEKIIVINDDIQALNDEKLGISRQLSEAYQNVTLSRPGWEKEIEEMTSFLPKQPSVKETFDPLFEEAAKLVVNSQQGSTSMIQRKFSLGYNRAGRIIDELEKVGIVGSQNGSRPREVLIQDETSLKELLSNIE